MTDQRADRPAFFSGSQTPDQFLEAMGNVWIGLIETIASDPDQHVALAAYFSVTPRIIRDWIDARGRTRCIATVPDKGRCSRLVGPKIEYDPRVWSEEQLRCSVHGPG